MPVWTSVVTFAQRQRLAGITKYDYIPLTETTLGVAIGDVKGHGLPATIIQHVHHTASDIKKSILTEFFAHCQQHEQEDDVTLIVIKRKK